MSESYQTFKKAISDAHELVDCYDKLNQSPESVAPEVLKRAALIMILTAWETYVEDIAAEIFDKKFNMLKGCAIGQFMDKQFEKRLKMFHNPDSQKTKQIFEEFFDVDVTESWTFTNYIPKLAREQLNIWIAKRGDAVHRAQIDLSQPQIITRKELDKCIRFFKDLVQKTDEVLVLI
ncbi:hypothetical protein GNT65_15700 [Shewanella sp. JBTF-M18]|uniref:RiboL-PSP-HEPN domain-containing protein n=1 Tax=Shewanella insulae TaxID=2681496 RepID=A0A6L7I0M5_9GAMM|nr:HEPN domain-containing protein [Shewanella insulae]MXR70109.1 hypothetical protein [Shewanella insulae]